MNVSSVPSHCPSLKCEVVQKRSCLSSYISVCLDTQRAASFFLSLASLLLLLSTFALTSAIQLSCCGQSPLLPILPYIPTY